MNAREDQRLPVDFFTVTTDWRQRYPGAHAGVLVISNSANPARSEPLEDEKRRVEERLRHRFAGLDRVGLRADPILRAYEEHYRRFDKTYHVLLQLESILLKGKSIPSAAALVEAMFMAEVESRLLTAGHDFTAVRGRLTLDVARGDENYVLLRGTPQAPKAGDMMISDESGIISSVVYGPDERTQIRAGTVTAVFTVYAPEGIIREAIHGHLEKIKEYALLIAPETQTLLLTSYPAD